MRQGSLITLVSLLALFLGGCPSDNDGQAGKSSPSPAAVARRVTPKPAATPSFANPLTAKQPGNTTAVTGLIQTLPPEARVKQITQGRPDPFAAIPVQPEVTVSPNQPAGGEQGTGSRPVPVIPQLPAPVRTPRGSNRQPAATPKTTPRRTTPQRTTPQRTTPQRTTPQRTTPQRTTPPKPKVNVTPKPSGSTTRPGSATLPPVATAPRLIPQLPMLPEPTLAKSIEVSGVAEVSGVPKAIVTVPNEPSRTVQAGERLGNGQVLVKRIEANRGPTPVVVLEQYGIEVTRQVGDKPEGASGQPGAPTPSRAPTPPPVPTPGNTNNAPLPPPPPVPGNEGV